MERGIEKRREMERGIEKRREMERGVEKRREREKDGDMKKRGRTTEGGEERQAGPAKTRESESVREQVR